MYLCAFIRVWKDIHISAFILGCGIMGDLNYIICIFLYFPHFLIPEIQSWEKIFFKQYPWWEYKEMIL